MIIRQIEEKIDNWIKKERNALLIEGARQVGKTFTIRECLKRSGTDHLEINLIDEPDLISIFEKSSSVKELTENLSLAKNHRFIKHKTILFIDEVQEYKDILTRIKFWVDEGSYRYILSGSLLGIELIDLRSAPVGYLNTIRMYPLDFQEFLKASGVIEDTFMTLQNAFDNKKPLSDTVHKKMMEHFRRYLVIGGMPAAVQKYISDGDMNAVSEIQANIILQYKKDFTKYETKDKKFMIEAVYDRIPSELLKQNRRFSYTKIKNGLKYERIEDSFLWLKAAGVAIFVCNATEPRLSLKQNEKSSLVKIYLSDVGLLTQQYGSNVKLDILLDKSAVNCGGIYENAVAMELSKHGFDTWYYNSRKLGELDFVIEYKNSVLPIEVKSGKDYYIHSAINNVLNIPDFEINEAIVFSNYNLSTNGKITYLPIYMSTLLKKDVSLPILKPII